MKREKRTPSLQKANLETNAICRGSGTKLQSAGKENQGGKRGRMEVVSAKGKGENKKEPIKEPKVTS